MRGFRSDRIALQIGRSLRMFALIVALFMGAAAGQEARAQAAMKMIVDSDGVTDDVRKFGWAAAICFATRAAAKSARSF